MRNNTPEESEHKAEAVKAAPCCSSASTDTNYHNLKLCAEEGHCGYSHHSSKAPPSKTIAALWPSTHLPGSHHSTRFHLHSATVFTCRYIYCTQIYYLLQHNGAPDTSTPEKRPSSGAEHLNSSQHANTHKQPTALNYEPAYS